MSKARLIELAEAWVEAAVSVQSAYDRGTSHEVKECEDSLSEKEDEFKNYVAHLHLPE